jgi:transcriptional regulator with XRE-family HTH domain
MDADNPIGRFLRARRELVRPEDVGLPDFGRRRVPGLRREELAMLAGVSADYYVRLEQGRDQHPSEQVLDALARALRLDDDAAAHLHELARPAPRRRRRAAARSERVRPGLLSLMDSWTHTPAFVLGRCLDVLAANRLAAALNPGCRPGGNMVRSAFLDPDAAATYPDMADIRRDTVAALRASIGPDLDDPALTELVGELSLKSEEFRRLWARHDVREKTSGRKRILHPQVGELDLLYESFAVNGAGGQLLVTYHADANSPTAQALALLSSMTAADAAPAGERAATPRP